MLRWFVSLALALALIIGLGVLTLQWNPGFAYPAVALDHRATLPQGDFYRGAYSEVSNTNPFTTTDGTALRIVLRFTHEALLDIDPVSGDLRPALAQSYQLSEDGRVAEFELRQDLEFSDGSPVTMEDVAFTMAIGCNPASGGSVQQAEMQAIEEFQALDDRRFKITLEQRHYAGLRKVATNLRIVSRQFFTEEVARLARSEQVPVPDDPKSPEFIRLFQQIQRAGPATGPYEIGRDAEGNPTWQLGRSLTLVQNPLNWRRREQLAGWNLAGIHLRFMIDPSARLNALMQGEIDWYASQDESLTNLLAREPAIDEAYRLHTYDSAQMGPYLIIWNHRREGLGDARVRRALTMLFDRHTIVDKLLSGVARIPSCWFKPGTPEVPEDLEPLSFDPDAAKQLLGEAGYGPENPLQLSILTYSGWALGRQILDLAMPAFAMAEVDLELRTLPGPNVKKKRDDGDFDGILYLQYLQSPNDPAQFFNSQDNDMGYASEEVDHILSAASKELDSERRAALYRQFSEIFHFDQPVTLLAFPLNQILLHKRFQDVQVGPLGLYPERWWVRPEDQVIKASNSH